MTTSILQRQSEQETVSTEELAMEEYEFRYEVTAVERDFAAEDEDGVALNKAIFANLVTP